MIPPPQESNGWFVRSVESVTPFVLSGKIVRGMAWMYFSDEDDQPIDIDMYDFSQRYPFEDNITLILNELCKLIDVDLPLETQYRVMYQGEPQSGKSLLQFIGLWYYCFVLKKGTVHIIMNSLGSLMQNIKRDYINLCKNIKDICTFLEIPDYENYIFNYIPFQAAENRKTESPEYTVYVSMANVAQLTRVVNLDVSRRLAIISDESDILIQKHDHPVMNLITQIMSNAEYRIECTATPFSNFNEENQKYDTVIQIPTKPGYRGYDKLDKHIVTAEQLDDMTDILTDAFTRDTWGFKNIILINTDSDTGEHVRIADKINNIFPHQVDIYIMNSNSDSYEIPIEDFMNKICNDVENKKPAVIVAGQMASRAVTFRTSRDNINQGFITSMIYSPSVSANQTTLMQAMRPYGNFDESYPPINVYWTRETGNIVESSFSNNIVITKSIKPGKESRVCMESVLVENIHRKFSSSDDSHFKKLEQLEFKTCEKLLNYINNFKQYSFTNVVKVSQKVEMVTVPEFTFGNVTCAQKHTIRNIISSQLGSGPIHVAWDLDRYDALFSIKSRLTPSREAFAIAKITCGNPVKTGPQTKIACVTWKDGYEDVRNWNDMDTVYLFQTTKGRWKMWLPRQLNRFSKLEHV